MSENGGLRVSLRPFCIISPAITGGRSRVFLLKAFRNRPAYSIQVKDQKVSSKLLILGSYQTVNWLMNFERSKQHTSQMLFFPLFPPSNLLHLSFSTMFSTLLLFRVERVCCVLAPRAFPAPEKKSLKIKMSNQTCQTVVRLTRSQDIKLVTE